MATGTEASVCEAEILAHARFDHIRYAQVWEDADILCEAMPACRGRTLVSICSAGDNALALLTCDPERIVVLDLSAAQIACLQLRIAAMQVLEHTDFLHLMGARVMAPPDREVLFDRVLAALPAAARRFWETQRTPVLRHGAAGVGRFERYFRLFRRWVLPLAHNARTRERIFEPRDTTARREFFDREFNTWRWRLLVKGFFSSPVMGALGRDRAFFAHVQGSAAEHVSGRLEHAGVTLPPADNPYLHWIFHGHHGAALPMAWRAEHYAGIRARLDRLDIRHASLESFTASGEKAIGWNLSDIFEYMSSEVFDTVYAQILDASETSARLVYWNMMVPRRCPPGLAERVTPLDALAESLAARDKAFFYSAFRVEAVRA